MPGAENFLTFVRPLNRLRIRYCITGSVAAIFYGEPRLTHDVDIVMFLKFSEIPRLVEAFPAEEFYVPPLETIQIEAQREQRGHFNILHVETGFKADVYLTGQDELNAWALRSCREVQFEGERVVLAPPEYVMVRKLEYYREGGSDKHLRDIRSMVALLGDKLDHSILSEWIQRRGLQREWLTVSNEPDENEM